MIKAEKSIEEQIIESPEKFFKEEEEKEKERERNIKKLHQEKVENQKKLNVLDIEKEKKDVQRFLDTINLMKQQTEELENKLNGRTFRKLMKSKESRLN